MFFIPLCLPAQRNELLCSSLKTLTVSRNGKWNLIPYIGLGTRDHLEISFDDLTHEYRRYRYRIEPMTWDWKPNTRLLASEFLANGLDEESIDTYEESINTNVLYTHYSFSFPKENTIFKLSGNYRIVIFDDDNDEDVAIVPVYVVEQKAMVSAMVSADTDIDFYLKHQQVTFKLQPDPTLNVHYPETEIHTVVMQNLSPFTMVSNPKPDYVAPTGMQWQHNRDLIFPAGNEFHKFEMTTIKYGGLGMESVQWHDPYYHATLITCNTRENYVYDEDANGAFLVKSIDSSDEELESEYLLVHFFLKAKSDLQGMIYVDGDFTNHNLSSDYLMNYNPTSQLYEATVLMKQGCYNYQYVFVPDKGIDRNSLNAIQGDFYQTENRYSIFAYYSQRGARADRLIAIQDFNFSLR